MLITDELLLHYKRCPRRSFLNIYGNDLEKDCEKDFLLKLKQESENHSQKVLARHYPVYHQPQASREDWQGLSQQTQALMQQGVECIYQGKLSYTVNNHLTYLGSPTLLVKQPLASVFGNWSYATVTIQLGRRPKPEYKITSGFNAQILSHLQGITPTFAQIILRPENTYQLNLNYWIPRTQQFVRECLEMLQQKQEPEVFISRQRCSLCQWYSSCHAIAKSKQHLSLVPGITPKRYEILQKKGISSLESLSKISPQQINPAMESEVAINLQKQAQSILANSPLLKSQFIPSIPTSAIELYFDIEAEPERNLDYLLGILLIDRNNHQQKYYPFLAKTLTEEKKIWEDFLSFVNIYADFPIFHYSTYEVETVKRLAKLYQTPTPQIKALLSRLIDLHQQLLTSVILPIENYSLKSVANWLGFSWRNPYSGDKLNNGEIIAGDQCVCWYDRWLKTGDRTLLTCILRYNEDDCLATYHLKNWLVNYFHSLTNFSCNNK
jgi:uncharacterized protein